MAKDIPPKVRQYLLNHGMTEDELTTLENQNKPQSNSDSSGLVKASAEASKANEGYDPYVVNYAQWLRNAEYGARKSQGLSQTQQAQLKQDYQDLIDNAPDGLSEYIEGKGYKYDADDATTNWVRDYQDRISAPPTPTSGNSTPANTTATPTTPAPKQHQPTTPKPTTQQQAVTPTQPTTTPSSMAKQPQKAQPPTPPKPNEDEDIVLTNGSNTAGKIATAQPNTAMQGGFTPTPQTTPNNEPIKPSTPTAAPTEQTPATPAKSATRQLIDDINAKSEEERQRIEKRRQAEETISGIADMGKALSNLYFTGKGAPNMYDPKTVMTPKARERYERALKNWEKNRAAAMSYAFSKQSADLKEESNRIAQGRLEEQERHNKVVEGRQQEQLDFTKAQKEIENALKEEGLSLRERIARMNNATQQMKISQRSTLISPYKKVREKVRDPKTGEVSEIEYRFTVDPITGEIKGEELRNVSGGKNKTGGTTQQKTSTQTATAGQNGGNNNYSGNLKNTRNLNL